MSLIGYRPIAVKYSKYSYLTTNPSQLSKLWYRELKRKQNSTFFILPLLCTSILCSNWVGHNHTYPLIWGSSMHWVPIPRFKIVRVHTNLVQINKQYPPFCLKTQSDTPFPKNHGIKKRTPFCLLLLTKIPFGRKTQITCYRFTCSFVQP